MNNEFIENIQNQLLKQNMEGLKNLIISLVFAYVNKDEDMPHSFEKEAIELAAKIVPDNQFVQAAWERMQTHPTNPYNFKELDILSASKMIEDKAKNERFFAAQLCKAALVLKKFEHDKEWCAEKCPFQSCANQCDISVIIKAAEEAEILLKTIVR